VAPLILTYQYVRTIATKKEILHLRYFLVVHPEEGVEQQMWDVTITLGYFAADSPDMCDAALRRWIHLLAA
jgi:hypothetical protein